MTICTRLHDLCKYPQNPLRYTVSILETEKIGVKFPPPTEKRGRFWKRRVDFFIVCYIQNCTHLKKKKSILHMSSNSWLPVSWLLAMRDNITILCMDAIFNPPPPLTFASVFNKIICNGTIYCSSKRRTIRAVVLLRYCYSGPSIHVY